MVRPLSANAFTKEDLCSSAKKGVNSPLLVLRCGPMVSFAIQAELKREVGGVTQAAKEDFIQASVVEHVGPHLDAPGFLHCFDH